MNDMKCQGVILMGVKNNKISYRYCIHYYLDDELILFMESFSKEIDCDYNAITYMVDYLQTRKVKSDNILLCHIEKYHNKKSTIILDINNY